MSRRIPGVNAIDSAVPMSIPGYGGSSSGGLLLLLVGAYLLVAFVTGRLQWLTGAVSDLFQTKATYSAPATQPPAPGTAAPGALPLYSFRPRTVPRARYAV